MIGEESRIQNINEKNGKQKTALHYGSENGSLEVVKFLIENGAETKIKDTDGNTPLDE